MTRWDDLPASPEWETGTRWDDLAAFAWADLALLDAVAADDRARAAEDAAYLAALDGPLLDALADD